MFAVNEWFLFTLLKLFCLKSLLCWNRACVEIFVLRKDKLCMWKPVITVITQKLVLKITQYFTGSIPIHERFWTQEFSVCISSFVYWTMFTVNIFTGYRPSVQTSFFSDLGELRGFAHFARIFLLCSLPTLNSVLSNQSHFTCGKFFAESWFRNASLLWFVLDSNNKIQEIL
jgi:hypothetical protein